MRDISPSGGPALSHSPVHFSLGVCSDESNPENLLLIGLGGRYASRKIELGLHTLTETKIDF